MRDSDLWIAAVSLCLSILKQGSLVPGRRLGLSSIRVNGLHPCKLELLENSGPQLEGVALDSEAVILVEP